MMAEGYSSGTIRQHQVSHRADCNTATLFRTAFRVLLQRDCDALLVRLALLPFLHFGLRAQFLCCRNGTQESHSAQEIGQERPREAKDAGLLRDEGFPSLQNRRANAEELNQPMTEILGRDPGPQPNVPYVDVLIQAFPWLRNRAAHPNMQSIMPPGMALDGLILAAEIINQLWPKPSG